MSTGEKRPYAQVHKIATQLVERLVPACHRIEIAGSLRRQRELVGDIEIICIPILYEDLFGNPTDKSQVDTLLSTWPIRRIKDGDKYKQFGLNTGKGTYTVDLFLQPDPATWGVNFLIRTGSAHFSHRMVSPKWQGGYKPNHLRIEDARVWQDCTMLDTPEEEDVFRLWGMEYIEPQNRD